MRIEILQNPPTVAQLIERFAARKLSFVLDSAQSNDGLGGWSFFGADPFSVIQGKEGKYEQFSTAEGGISEVSCSDGIDGLALLRSALGQYAEKKECTTHIPFCGGAVGFLSYDFVRRIEKLPCMAKDDRDIPDLHFGLYDGIVALNHETGELFLVALGIRGPEEVIIAELKVAVFGEIESNFDAESLQVASSWQWNLSPSEFKNRVSEVRRFIASGDVYQVNLSRRARARFSGDAGQLYRHLREGNPAPYCSFIDAGYLQLISTSPEQFLRKRGRRLETRPIKGTRPRGRDAAEDARNSDELRGSMKDRAELLMIVDLERNDFGRVAEFGSVVVDELYQLEYYKEVIHQTAQVRATLREDLDVFDAIRALFPGGSITGAPKIRAMELIEELEPTRRGAYCGSIGYIGFNGDAELSIAIRTLHLKGGYLDYQVGGGIIWDSDLEQEYEETLDKGRAIRETLDQL